MKEADREGNLDSNIKDYVPNDIEKFLFTHPTITTIVLNGTGYTTRAFEDNFSVEELKRKYKIISLPSTSNSRPMSFEDKLKKWNIIREILYAKSEQ
jgi:hypoxanthine-DNA glycosylase